ncbi:hypothetical protein BDB01DRAFT_511122 [Pilobolus umbonatus]|nr:hypothetical protein BDB01DRAFT_511122 [Pilobolus umbonatus]
MESSYSLNYSSAPNRIVDPNFSYSHSEFHHNTPVVESAIVQPPETSYQSYQKSTVNYYYNTPQKSMGNTYGSSTDFDSTSNNSPTITAASTHYKTTESFTSNQDQYNSKYGMNATYRENTYTTNYQGNINENSAYSHPTTTPSLSHTQPDYTNRQPDLTTDDIYDSYLSDNPTSATNQRYNYM